MKTLCICLLLFTATHANAQTLKANVSDLAFMAGTWTQNHECGDMEEHWGKPMGNCMASSFRCVKDGKVVFYEFVVIEQGENVPVLKMRHFNAGNIAWEDKNAPILFPLIGLDKQTAIFESTDKTLKMTYKVEIEKTMLITLEEKEKSGAWTTIVFNFKYNP